MNLIAVAFVVLMPFIVYAAHFTVGLYRADPTVGAALALAIVTVAAATIGVFLGIASLLYLLGETAISAAIAPGILPSFALLELLFIVVPAYLRWRLRKGK